MKIVKAQAPAIVVTEQVTQSLTRATRPSLRSHSVAEMLSTLNAQAGMLIEELARAEEPLAKRISMAKDVAKLLPLLDRAERRCSPTVRGKAVEDMTDQELRAEYKAARAGAK